MNDLEHEILLTIQQLAAIFIKKGIPAVPVCVEHLGLDMTPEMEKLIIKELLMQLDDLFLEYSHKENKIHKYLYLLRHFYQIIDENTLDDGNFIGRPKIITKI